MGTPHYADTILKRLIEADGMKVAALFTQPDRPVGRKRVLTPPPVKVTAQKEMIAIFQPDSLRDEEIMRQIEEIAPDFIVVAAYGQMLPKEILQIAPCINLHASLLPMYRGASPIQQSLLNGDSVTGVTAMLMEEGLDSGPILSWSVTKLQLSDRKESLFLKLADMAAELTVETLRNFSSVLPLPQCDAEATYCKKIRKEDGLISFELSALQIYNRFRAFEGWPGIYLENGLKLIDLELYEADGTPGHVVKILDDGVVVACKKGALKILRVQPPSKKSMDVLSYIRGKRIGVEDLFV